MDNRVVRFIEEGEDLLSVVEIDTPAHSTRLETLWRAVKEIGESLRATLRPIAAAR